MEERGAPWINTVVFDHAEEEAVFFLSSCTSPHGLRLGRPPPVGPSLLLRIGRALDFPTEPEPPALGLLRGGTKNREGRRDRPYDCLLYGDLASTSTTRFGRESKQK